MLSTTRANLIPVPLVYFKVNTSPPKHTSYLAPMRVLFLILVFFSVVCAIFADIPLSPWPQNVPEPTEDVSGVYDVIL